MPAYALPGTGVGPRRARILGIATILVAALIIVGWRVAPDTGSPGQIRVTLITNHVGEGIKPGADVRLDGVRVGQVSAIDITGQRRQQIELRLQQSALFGLTDALSVDYAPDNLFGISALQLHSNSGGTALADGSSVDLTGPDADRVRDATLSALLESTGRLTNNVLTPKLTAVLSKISGDISAFTPLLQAIGATAHSFADTQKLPPSLLFDSFGSALAGLPPMLSGGLDVLDSVYTNRYFQSPEHIVRYGQMFTDIQSQLLPTVTKTSGTGQRYFAGFIPIATAILDQLSMSVSTPTRSERQLTELLDRLDAGFHNSPSGPVLDARVELDSVPGLAMPLSTLLDGYPALGGH